MSAKKSPKKKPGRPAKKARPAGLVSIRLSSTLRERVDALAEAQQTTLTDIIVTVLDRHLGDTDVLTRLDDLAARLAKLEHQPQQLSFKFAGDVDQEIFGHALASASGDPASEVTEDAEATEAEPEPSDEPDAESEAAPVEPSNAQRPWAHA